MASLFDPAARARLVTRLDALTAATPARWGKFDATRMLAHLNDSLRMATGELAVAPRPGPLNNVVMRTLIIYVLPFPKGAPTATELLVRGTNAEFGAERATFRTLVEGTATRPASASWADHPAFGRMTRKDWGALAHKHIDHHFRQFGI